MLLNALLKFCRKSRIEIGSAGVEHVAVHLDLQAFIAAFDFRLVICVDVATAVAKAVRAEIERFSKCGDGGLDKVRVCERLWACVKVLIAATTVVR